MSYTIHEWRKFGVRPCVVLNSVGDRHVRVEIAGRAYLLPAGQVYPTAHAALDAARDQQRRLVAQQINYWTRFSAREIEVRG